MTSVFRLFSPLQKNNRLRTPRVRRRFRYSALLPPPSFPLSAGVNVPNVSPIVSLNDSPSVPATCKMTGGATPDRLRPVGGSQPLPRSIVCSRCRPSPYGGPVAVGRDAWPQPPVGNPHPPGSRRRAPWCGLIASPKSPRRLAKSLFHLLIYLIFDRVEASEKPNLNHFFHVPEYARMERPKARL